MKSILKHVYRNIIEKKFRTIIVVIAIILVSALLYINFQLKDIIVDRYTKYFTITSGSADLFIADDKNYFFKESDIDLNQVEKVDKLPMLQYLGKFKEKSGKQRKFVLTGADYSTAETMELVKLGAKSIEKTMGTRDVIISKKFADSEGYKIGDKITITINNKAEDFTIFGLAEDKGIFYSELSTLQAMIKLDSLQSIISHNNDISGIYISLANDNNAKAKDQIIYKNADSSLTVTDTVDKTKINEKVSSISMILNLALILVLVLSGTVLLSLYKHIHNDRLPAIATFRSIGATKTKTSFFLILETCMYGFVGGILGVALGVFILPNVYNMISGESLGDFSTFNFIKAIISILLTIIVALLTTSFELFKLSSRSVKDAIFNTAAIPYSISKGKTIIGLIIIVAGAILLPLRAQTKILSVVSPILVFIGFLLMIPVLGKWLSYGLDKIVTERFPVIKFALKNIRKNKIIIQNIKIVSIVSTLAICVFAVSNTVNVYLNEARNLKADVVVTIDSLTPQKDAEKITKLEGVKNACIIYATTLDLKSGDKKVKANLYGRSENDNFDVIFDGAISSLSTSIDKMSSDEIILDKYLAEQLDVKINDKVKFKMNDKDYELKVIGIMDSYKLASDKSTAFLSLDSFKKLISDVPKVIYITSDLSAEKEKNIINEYILDSDSTVVTFDEFVSGQRSQINSIVSIVQLVVIAGIIICFLGIVNNLLVGYISRKKEFATLYSCAMNKRQLKKVIMSEVLIQLFIAVVFLSILSSALVYQMTGLIDFIGLSIQVTYPVNMYLGCCIALTVVHVIAGFSMFSVVNKLQVMKELRYE